MPVPSSLPADRSYTYHLQLLSLRNLLVPVIRAPADIYDSKIAAWRAFPNRSCPCPFQILVQMPVFRIITVAEGRIKLQTIILLAHGVIWAGDDIESGDSGIARLRHPVFKSCLRAEVAKRVFHHSRGIPVVIPADMLIPGNRCKQDTAEFTEESANHIRRVF